LALPGTNVGEYENTGWDLVVNLAGCLLAAVAIRLLGNRLSSENEQEAKKFLGYHAEA
jgi:hypothetical protein